MEGIMCLFGGTEETFSDTKKCIRKWWGHNGKNKKKTLLLIFRIEAFKFQKLNNNFFFTHFVISSYFSIFQKKKSSRCWITIRKKEAKGAEIEKDSIHLWPDYEKEKDLVDSDHRRPRRWRKKRGDLMTAWRDIDFETDCACTSAVRWTRPRVHQSKKKGKII